MSLVFSYSQNFNRFLREGKLITLTKHNPQIQFLYLTDTRGEISWLWGGDGSSLLMAICLKEVAVICSWFSLASLYLGLWSPGLQTAVRVVWDRKNTLISRQGCVEGPWRMWVCKASPGGTLQQHQKRAQGLCVSNCLQMEWVGHCCAKSDWSTLLLKGKEKEDFTAYIGLH